MKSTAIILGGLGHDQTGAIQSALNAVGVATWSPAGRDDWEQVQDSTDFAEKVHGPLVVIGHSFGVELVQTLCDLVVVDVAFLVDPVSSGEWWNPFAERHEPKAKRVVVFERSDWSRVLPPYTVKVNGASQIVNVRAGHNSICRDAGLIQRIVAEVKAL